MDSDWQNIISAAFAVMWVGGTLVLYFRAYAKQHAYLRHFAHEYPYLAGEPLFDIPRTLRAYRDVRRLARQRQSDPELERLRREGRRRYRYMLVWVYGFPILCIGVAALLIATGIVHLLP